MVEGVGERDLAAHAVAEQERPQIGMARDDRRGGTCRGRRGSRRTGARAPGCRRSARGRGGRARRRPSRRAPARRRPSRTGRSARPSRGRSAALRAGRRRATSPASTARRPRRRRAARRRAPRGQRAPPAPTRSRSTCTSAPSARFSRATARPGSPGRGHGVGALGEVVEPVVAVAGGERLVDDVVVLPHDDPGVADRLAARCAPTRSTAAERGSSSASSTGCSSTERVAARGW